MIRSKSTSALGQPSDTRPTRGAGFDRERCGFAVDLDEELRADLVADFCMVGL